jgi:hypothetical protein
VTVEYEVRNVFSETGKPDLASSFMSGDVDFYHIIDFCIRSCDELPGPGRESSVTTRRNKRRALVVVAN